MGPLMRWALVVALIFGLASVTPLPATSMPQATKITVSYFGDWESTYIVAVGLKEGFFKAAGLDVKPAQFNSGPPGVAALNSGTLNFSFIGPGPIKLAMSGQATILGISDLSITDHLIAKAGFKNAGSLKGKTVIYAKGTVEEVILALALGEYNMKPEDVKLVNIPDFATQVTAYLSGTADAIAASAPFSNTILQKDPKSHIIYSDGTIYPRLVMPDSWVTSSSMLKAHRDTVVRFMWALEKIENWSVAHINGSIMDVAQFTKQTPAIVAQNAPPENAKIIAPLDLVAKYKDGTARHWYEAIGKVFVETGRIQSVPPASTYLDFGPAIDASKTLNQASF
jgi:ABC-type nitrate/sulfonate/bicarbonate transport system substrate-binding protein